MNLEYSKKKIGIITFHRSYNYGSALQAYALEKLLRSQGYDAKIIDFIMPWDFEQYRLFRTKIYLKSPKSFMADIVFFFRNYKRKKAFETFVQKNMVLTDRQYTDVSQMKELNDEFDAFICGSDQIWNFDCTNGIEPAYFLEFANSDKIKISYAPSIAQLQFNVEISAKLRSYLSSFNAISVREGGTIPTIRAVAPQNIKVTVDPTILLDQSDYLSLVKPGDSISYVFVYMLEENRELLEYARRVAEMYSLHTIYLTKKTRRIFKNAKNVYGASPNEFLGYINGAKYIITNSFHATVFSILFEKQFCTFRTEKSYIRMVELLNMVGLDDRIYSEKFILDKEINFHSAKEKLTILRMDSLRFLQKALSQTTPEDQ